jgi:cytochrome b6-f complex iron-sulfur subunit
MFMMDANKSTHGDVTGRRAFLGIGLAGAGVSVFALLAGTVRFFFPKVLFESPSVFPAGRPGDYRAGEISERFKESNRVWIIKTTDGRLYAIEAKCTHLGCTPQWFVDESKFECPCHGSNFNVDGDVLAGPAPVPLFRVSIRLDSRGGIIIDKRVKENQVTERDRPPFVIIDKGDDA